MCHKATTRARRLSMLVALAAGAAFSQSSTPRSEWRRIGTAAVDLMLASPATGPVDQVWFSTDASRLFARTRFGRVFETSDFETWSIAASAADPPADPPPAAVSRLPEPGAR
ncbi:MAG TPA: hypothetical protein VG672_15770, partial [Bryobacteraceae bacterium]|nr:hypothetical protein [Bryobacteraceae bacterium]